MTWRVFRYDVGEFGWNNLSVLGLITIMFVIIYLQYIFIMISRSDRQDRRKCYRTKGGPDQLTMFVLHRNPYTSVAQKG